MDLKILGVPLDLGANRRGTDMGPSAIRVANVADRLRQLDHDVQDLGNLYTPTAETRTVTHEKLQYLDEIVQVADNIARRVETIADEGSFPLVLGGDHSLSIGSVGGLARTGDRVGLVWVDAHGDFNTPATSPSGNVHGMPLSALVGTGHDALVEAAGVSPKVQPEDAAVVGIRSLDPPEREVIRGSGVTVFTMQDVDTLGMREVMVRALDVATEGTDRLHISLDIDSVDPQEAPGVGTPVPGGLTYREAHLAMELASREGTLGSMDVVEVNPLLDERNRTAELAAELVASALGKKIL